MATDLVCFSHLRWDFVFQRPNHLMSRAARDRRVYYVEEPLPAEPGAADHVVTAVREGVVVVTPVLADGPVDLERRQEHLLRDYLGSQGVHRPVHWLQTPMAVSLSEALGRAVVVYDCMDDLTSFAEAPAKLQEREQRLLQTADLVITGGVSLQRRIADRRPDAICLPSSVDTAHFQRATTTVAPLDVASLPRPRFGYVGVIDERIDMDLVRALAGANPAGSVVLIGPVAKIDPDTIPVLPNVHQLGARRYEELPAYLGALDVGIMPFAHNPATRYISPTKTPEYLAAGLPVASTGITDVQTPYGRIGLVEVGDGADGFVAACRRALATDLARHRAFASDFLRTRSWDETWATIDGRLRQIERTLAPRVPATRSVPTSAGRRDRAAAESARETRAAAS